MAVVPTKQGMKPIVAFMTKGGGAVLLQDIKDLDLVTYDFSGIPAEERSKFNFLKNCFGIDTIRPDQFEQLFGSRMVMAYAYAACMSGPKIHTIQQFVDAVASGRITHNTVTIRLTDW